VRRMLGSLCVLAVVAACQEAAPEGPAPLPAFELRPVAAVKVAELEARLEPVAIPEATPEVIEQAEGLVIFLSSAGSGMADAAFEDVKRLGDAAIAPLLAVFHDMERHVDERRAALRLIGELKSPAAVDALLVEASDNPEPSMRALAAWKLGMMGDDACVPQLIKRLKYESAPEVEPWLARTLADFDNFAGVEALSVLASWQGPGSEAAVHLNQIAQDAGFVEPDPAVEGDTLVYPYKLLEAWHAGDPESRLPLTAPRSDRFKLIVWRWIAGFADFQLRGVDDGRYIVADLRPEMAAQVAEALHDDNRYIRTHVAQALGRMGARGRDAAPELAAAIGDPTLSITAVESLAAVCAPAPGAPAPELEFSPVELITTCTEAGRDSGLRLAAVRSLGILRDKSAIEALDALVQDPAQFAELRQAAAESLAALGEGRRVAAGLVAFARDENLDATTSMRALRSWIGTEARAGELWASDLATEWDTLAPSQFVAPTIEAANQRQVQRLALVDAALDALTKSAQN